VYLSQPQHREKIKTTGTDIFSTVGVSNVKPQTDFVIWIFAQKRSSVNG